VSHCRGKGGGVGPRPHLMCGLESRHPCRPWSTGGKGEKTRGLYNGGKGKVYSDHPLPGAEKNLKKGSVTSELGRKRGKKGGEKNQLQPRSLLLRKPKKKSTERSHRRSSRRGTQPQKERQAVRSGAPLRKKRGKRIRIRRDQTTTANHDALTASPLRGSSPPPYALAQREEKKGAANSVGCNGKKGEGGARLDSPWWTKENYILYLNAAQKGGEKKSAGR